MIEGHDDRSAAALVENPVQADLFAIISQALSPVKRYNRRKSRLSRRSCQ
jgi:hypothetical protein